MEDLPCLDHDSWLHVLQFGDNKTVARFAQVLDAIVGRAYLSSLLNTRQSRSVNRP
jgi:hypothetical protein